MEIQKQPTAKVIEKSLAKELQTRLHGKAITPEDPDYDTARKAWNGMFDHRRPALIVRCGQTRDVVEAVRFARREDLEISVRGGGHSIPGYSTSDGGILIDLSPMKDVLVNLEKKTALAGAGLTLGEFIQATESYGLATTTGTASETGIAGLTLGSGAGWLMSKYGLTCDNVLSFEVVTAEGEVLRASAAENPDLFWGLRGGGGNFGIVTTFEYQLHPVSTVLGGMVIHRLSKGSDVLRFYRDFTAQLPDDLTVYAAVITTPDGNPVVAMLACYFGDDLATGERVLAPLRSFGDPLADMIHPMPYSKMISLIDAASPSGWNYFDKGLTLPGLPDAAIDQVIDAGERRTSPFSMVLLQHVHGAAARIPMEATAFPVRMECYMPVILGAWNSGPAQPHIQWVRNTYQALQPFSVSATYVNFMSEEEKAHVPTAYGKNYARLVALKQRYDPQNVFHNNTNIKP